MRERELENIFRIDLSYNGDVHVTYLAGVNGFWSWVPHYVLLENTKHEVRELRKEMRALNQRYGNSKIEIKDVTH